MASIPDLPVHILMQCLTKASGLSAEDLARLDCVSFHLHQPLLQPPNRLWSAPKHAAYERCMSHPVLTGTSREKLDEIRNSLDGSWLKVLRFLDGVERAWQLANRTPQSRWQLQVSFAAAGSKHDSLRTAKQAAGFPCRYVLPQSLIVSVSDAVLESRLKFGHTRIQAPDRDFTFSGTRQDVHFLQVVPSFVTNSIAWSLTARLNARVYTSTTASVERSAISCWDALCQLLLLLYTRAGGLLLPNCEHTSHVCATCGGCCFLCLHRRRRCTPATTALSPSLRADISGSTAQAQGMQRPAVVTTPESRELTDCCSGL